MCIFHQNAGATIPRGALALQIVTINKEDSAIKNENFSIKIGLCITKKLRKMEREYKNTYSKNKKERALCE